jgi:hypothetical protein
MKKKGNDFKNKKSNKNSNRNSKIFSDKFVIILVILALIFAIFAISYHYFDLGEKVPTKSNVQGDLSDNSGGKVGIQILPPYIEDKGVNENE